MKSNRVELEKKRPQIVNYFEESKSFLLYGWKHKTFCSFSPSYWYFLHNENNKNKYFVLERQTYFHITSKCILLLKNETFAMEFHHLWRIEHIKCLSWSSSSSNSSQRDARPAPNKHLLCYFCWFFIKFHPIFYCVQYDFFLQIRISGVLCLRSYVFNLGRVFIFPALLSLKFERQVRL